MICYSCLKTQDDFKRCADAGRFCGIFLQRVMRPGWVEKISETEARGRPTGRKQQERVKRELEGKEG